METVPSQEVILDTFTNHGMCRAQHSFQVCLACHHYFCHRWDTGQKYLAEYRKRSLHVTPGRVRSWEREDMRGDVEALLRDGTAEETLLVVALSKKKHLIPLPCCRVTPPNQRALFVQVEEESVVLTPETYDATREPFDQLLRLGCRKGEILSGDYHPMTLRKAPIADVVALDARIAPWRPSGLLTLISYITILEDADDASERADAG